MGSEGWGEGCGVQGEGWDVGWGVRGVGWGVKDVG